MTVYDGANQRRPSALQARDDDDDDDGLDAAFQNGTCVSQQTRKVECQYLGHSLLMNKSSTEPFNTATTCHHPTGPKKITRVNYKSNRKMSIENMIARQTSPIDSTLAPSIRREIASSERPLFTASISCEQGRWIFVYKKYFKKVWIYKKCGKNKATKRKK